MNDVNTLKQKAIDFMANMELSKLSMEELIMYVNAIQTINAMGKSDYMDNLIKMISNNKPIGFAGAEKGEE